jgi:DNA-binding transcriptional MerR regulator
MKNRSQCASGFFVHPLREPHGQRHATTLKYYEEDLKRVARVLRLRSPGFSLHGITEMLKRPLEPVEGGHRYSTESLQQIRDAIAQQVEALDARIEAVRRELKETRHCAPNSPPPRPRLSRATPRR